jgi:hypothetical protein
LIRVHAQASKAAECYSEKFTVCSLQLQNVCYQSQGYEISVGMVSIDDVDKQARGGFKVPVPELDGTWTAAPKFPSLPKIALIEESRTTQSTDKADKNDLGGLLNNLSYDELLERCARAEAACAMYENASRSLLSALALSPSANAFYARHARTLLAAALDALPSVATVGHVECSMPSIASGSESPVLQLVQYDGLRYSDVDWRPSSWWLSVAVVTGIALKVHVHVTDIRIAGRIRCSLPVDLSSVRIGFTRKPIMHVQIDTSIELGSVPVPLHTAIDTEIRHQISNFVVWTPA